MMILEMISNDTAFEKVFLLKIKKIVFGPINKKKIKTKNQKQHEVFMMVRTVHTYTYFSQTTRQLIFCTEHKETHVQRFLLHHELMSYRVQSCSFYCDQPSWGINWHKKIQNDAYTFTCNKNNNVKGIMYWFFYVVLMNSFRFFFFLILIRRSSLS